MTILNKNIIKQFFVIFGIILLGCERFVFISDCSECNIVPHLKDIYEYPITPGDEEWSNLSTTQLRIEACQLPENILEQISTAGLIETCIDWPLLPEIFFSDLSNGGAQETMGVYMTVFNGLEELSIRSDRGDYLCDHYMMNLPCCFIYTDVASFTFRLNIFEVILSQYVMLEGLDQNQLNMVIERSLENLDQKLKYPNEYSVVFGVSSSSIVLGRSLLLSGDSFFLDAMENYDNLSTFIDSGKLPQSINEMITMLDSLRLYANYHLTSK